DQINQLLGTKAQENKHEVRLKGADSFIFGRGGEECETHAENDVKFEEIPGITAAAGATAYAGIPLTHR
ncbi:SAM-dependent methyltransferase, partial [Vibrio echinoideorum]